MITKLQDRINVTSVLLVNAILIFIAEATGTLFFRTGLIHGIALLFVVLAIVAIVNRPIKDKFLYVFLYLAPIAALLLFALGHTLEFVGMVFHVGILPEDTHFVNVLNSHIAGILVVASASWFVLNTYTGRGSRIIPGILVGLAVVAVALTLFFFVTGADLSLSPTGALPYIYSATALVMVALGIAVLVRMKRAVPILKNFADNFIMTFIFIMIATAIVIFHDLLAKKLGIPVYQTIYWAHFALYLGLSFLFLTSRRLSTASPFYRDLEEFQGK